MRKKAAFEMSITTIIIIVIAVVMLILGMTLVRSIMCKAMSLTSDVGNGATKEIQRLFSTTGGEVQCIGSGLEPASMFAGQVNVVSCGINAGQQAGYSIEATSYSGSVSSPDTVKSWFIGNPSWSGQVAPNDNSAKKVLRISLPKEAPKELLTFQVSVKKNGILIASQDLDFQVGNVGFLQSALC